MRDGYYGLAPVAFGEFCQSRTERMLEFEDARRNLDDALASLPVEKYRPPRRVSGEHDFEEWALAVADGMTALW